MKYSWLMIISAVFITIQTANSNTNYYFGISGGYSNFDMTELRKVTNSISYYNIKLPVVDNFPNNFFGKLELYFIRDDFFRFGLNLRSESTGATSGLKDYSGEIRVEQFLSIYSYGASGFFSIKPNSYFDIMIGGELGITKSKYEVFQIYKVLNESNNSSGVEDFNNLYFQPGIKIEYPYKNFRFGIYADMYIGINDFYFSFSETALADDLDGLRLGIELSYLLY